MAAISEFGGGLLLALGFLNPLGSLGIMAAMLMAIAMVHWPKIWVTEGGLEYPLVNIAAAAALALTGPGLYSLDAYYGTSLQMPEMFLIGIVAVVISSAVALGTRARPAQSQVVAAESDQIEERRAA